jgi:hypothetical protein
MDTYIVETLNGEPLCDGCAESAHDIEQDGAPDELTPDDRLGQWGTVKVSRKDGTKCDNCRESLIDP